MKASDLRDRLNELLKTREDQNISVVIKSIGSGEESYGIVLELTDGFILEAFSL